MWDRLLRCVLGPVWLRLFGKQALESREVG